MNLIVAIMLCFIVVLCLVSFKAVLAFVAMAALAVVSPFLCLGLILLLLAAYLLFYK